MAVAVLLFVPWDRANQPHKLVTRLETEDGEPFEINGSAVKIEGDVEVGRPAGSRPGAELIVPVALRFESLPLTEGGYSWVVEVNGTELSRTSFEVVKG